MAYKPEEVEALRQQNIHNYLDAIVSGEAPLNSGAKYGHTIKLKSKERSIADEQNPSKIVYFQEDYAQRKFGDRFIEDVWKLCSSTKATYVQFATRESIIAALGGQYTEIVGLDESQYYGAIITDLEAFRKGMQKDTMNSLMGDMRSWFRTALCNPPLSSGWAVTTSDVFIFHRKEFFGGEDGKQSTFNCKMHIIKKYAQD